MIKIGVALLIFCNGFATKDFLLHNALNFHVLSILFYGALTNLFLLGHRLRTNYRTLPRTNPIYALRFLIF